LQHRPISGGICMYISIYICGNSWSGSGMQLPFKVNAHAVDTHMLIRFCGLNLGTRSRLHTSSQRPVVQYSQHLAGLRQLSANASWDCNLSRKSTYTCLLHEATPTNYALAHEAHIVLMHIPSVI